MKVVKDLKDVLSAYYRKYEKKQAEIEKARKLYQPEVAKEQIGRIEAAFRSEKEAVMDEVSALRDRAVTQIASWGKLDGMKINEGDSRLLKYDLNQEQFERIVERNKGNGTMCFILSQYAEKQNRKAREEDPEALKDGEALAQYGEAAVELFTMLLGKKTWIKLWNFTKGIIYGWYQILYRLSGM